MGIQKMRLANLQGKLTRNEMMHILGGSDDEGFPSTQEKCNCNSKDDCTSGKTCGADCDKSGTSYAGHCTT